MSYLHSMRRRVSGGFRLLRAERTIDNALKAYKLGEDHCDRSDFTPFELLYQTYAKHLKEVGADPFDPMWDGDEFDPVHTSLLTRVEFGIALSVVYIGECRRLPRTTTVIDGKRVKGLRYVKGPGSLTIRASAGRPKRVSP